MKTLHGRVTVIVVFLLCIYSLLAFLFTSSTYRAFAQEEQQRLNVSLASDLSKYLAKEKLLPVTPKNHRQLVAQIKRLMVINPSIDVYILQAEGKIVASSVEDDKAFTDHVDLSVLLAYIGGREHFPLRGVDPLGGPTTVFSAAKRNNDYVYVVLGHRGGTLADSMAGSYVLHLAAGALAGIAVFSAIGGAYFFWVITIRMRRLSEKVDLVSHNLVGAKVDEAPLGCDEVDRLDHAFDSMAGRLQTLIEELHRSDEERRDLVANVTHDLRTPIAGLRGYIETLQLRDASLTQSERDDYIQIATRQIDRLSGLIDGLMELAHLESARLQLRPELFLAAELAQDVLIDFRLRAEEKGIELRLKTQDGDTMICADIALVQRALANLVQNAIRHTPPGGWIEMGATAEPGFVRVSVGDSGSGIAAEDLDRMFERGVRVSDASDAGAGLGLAIVRRIVDLHHADVRVQSELGVGSRFCMFFPMPEPIQENGLTNYARQPPPRPDLN